MLGIYVSFIVMLAKAGIHGKGDGVVSNGSPIHPPTQALGGDDGDDGTFILKARYNVCIGFAELILRVWKMFATGEIEYA